MSLNNFETRNHLTSAPTLPNLVKRIASTVAAGALLIVPALTAGDLAFTNVTDSAGVTFEHTVIRDTPGLPMHGGGAVGDYDKDGWPDIFLVGGGNSLDKLFMNNGDGTFTNDAEAAGFTEFYRGNGAAAGDFDGDGWLDIFVTSFGDLPGDPAPGFHRLYKNNGDGTFTNVAPAAGASFSAPENADGYSPVWGDYDLDGDLDLWIGGWHKAPDGRFLGTRLFRNNGDETFTDVTTPAGVNNIKTQGFSAIFADMDGDRYPELLVSGDFGTSRYYINNGNGTFRSQAVLLPGTDKVHNGMGAAIGDVNRDGLLDWFVTSIYPAWMDDGPPGNRLYINKGNHEYEMVPESAGVNDGGWGWGALAVDFNHDGWVDLFNTNGWPDCPDPVTGECFLGEQTYLFMNNSDETFTEMALEVGIEHFEQGRGAATIDYDKDGDLDLFITTNQGMFSLYRNDLDLGAEDSSWLKVKLERGTNQRVAPNGRGTSVRITNSAGVTQVAQLTGHANYLTGSELIAHFGLSSSETLTEVAVNWADGFTTVLTDVAADQMITVVADNPYSHGDLVRGEVAELTVTGLREGEEARFIISTVGEGMGPCPDVVGGLCADIVNPLIVGSATADADGVAVLEITIPGSQAVDTMYSQAMVARGDNGELSLKTNVMMGELLDL